MIKYRIGYCPPNPGPKARPYCRWFTDVNELLKEYKEGDDVYVSYHGKPYIKTTIDNILEKIHSLSLFSKCKNNCKNNKNI